VIQVLLPFLIGGAIAVALTLVAWHYESPRRVVRESSAAHAESLAYLAGRVEESISQSARATKEVSSIAWTADWFAREAARTRKARALTDRHATNARLRRARARSGGRA
jgi:hypothetical protein